MVNVVVIGGGVNGIGSALSLQLLRPECKVTVLAEVFNPNTTGDGAAGFLEPNNYGETPEDKVREWSRTTWELFSDWHKTGENKRCGLSLIHGSVLFNVYEPLPVWHDIPQGYAALTPNQVAQYGPQYKSGHSFGTFTAEPRIFLPFLMQDVEARGGRLEKRFISSLEEAAAEADLVINCSGLGARDLVPDPSVYADRGQVMRVRAPWINNFLIDTSEESLAYIIPNQETVVLGGTQQDNNWNQEVDPVDSRTIWDRCTTLFPSLKSAEVVKEWVGLRPCRKKGVRLDTDQIKLGSRTVPVIHNYGHGGSGVTFFWGCSQEVARIASRLIHLRYGPCSKI